MYSPGNIALAMVQNQELTVFGTKDRWKSLGRSVRESEADNGVQIFARSPLGKGYSLTYAYDISQTSGREMKQTVLLDDTPQMENALGVLLNYSVVPIQTDGQMEDAAYYDAERKELYVNPNVEDEKPLCKSARFLSYEET